MKKLIVTAKATLLLSVLALTLIGLFPARSEALWVLCYDEGGDACIITEYNDDGERTARYFYSSWIMGN